MIAKPSAGSVRAERAGRTRDGPNALESRRYIIPVTPRVMIWVLIPVVIAVAIFGAWMHHRQEEKRRDELRKLADYLGWEFASMQDPLLLDRLTRFAELNRGHSKEAKNTLSGTIGMQTRPTRVWMGDYQYKITSGSGKNRSTRTHNLGYLLAELPFVTPPLSVRREGFFDKVGAAMGFDDIDFESKQFSDRFHVTGKNQRFAYDVIDPLMIEFLMGNTQPGGEAPTIHVREGLLLVIRRRSRWTPDEFHTNLAWAREFLDRWPRHVVDRLASSTGYA